MAGRGWAAARGRWGSLQPSWSRAACLWDVSGSRCTCKRDGFRGLPGGRAVRQQSVSPSPELLPHEPLLILRGPPRPEWKTSVSVCPVDPGHRRARHQASPHPLSPESGGCPRAHA